MRWRAERPREACAAPSPIPLPAPGRRVGLAALLVALVLLPFAVFPGAARAQATSEAQLRAAFLVNLLKYVEWPAGSEGATICLFGRQGLASQLASYEGRTILGRELRIRRVSEPDQLAGCQEVFVAEAEEEVLANLLKGVGRQAVLTVGESPAFVQQGGGIALVRVDNRLVFDVNLGALGRAGLKPSPQLLRLARDVMGAPR